MILCYLYIFTKLNTENNKDSKIRTNPFNKRKARQKIRKIKKKMV